MLRSFRVENHKSIRDEQELVFIPQYDKSKPVVPVVAIFGANASGKSNLLGALRWLQNAVRTSYASWEAGTGVPRTPFRLDPDYATKPSGYAVDVVLDGVRHDYGVVVDDERVVEEWLSTYPHGRRRVIFERKGDDIRLGSTVPDRGAVGDLLARHTRENAFFLTVAAQNDLDDIGPIYEWFRNAILFGDVDRIDESELRRSMTSAVDRDAVVSLMRAADLGISDVGIDSENPFQLSDEESDRFKRLVADSASDQGWRDLRVHLDDLVARSSRVSDRLTFHHGGQPTPLRLADQSAGTRSWMALISQALAVLHIGGLLVVDEVDASLHPHLTARLIGLFHDADNNPSAAQLLFTTHDATLLDDDTLARDEVWFVEKDTESGASRLFALSQFHPRKNEDTEGRYLAGAYGAVPILAGSEFSEAIRRHRKDDNAAA